MLGRRKSAAASGLLVASASWLGSPSRAVDLGEKISIHGYGSSGTDLGSGAKALRIGS